MGAGKPRLKAESGWETSNIQHPTSNIEHPVNGSKCLRSSAFVHRGVTSCGQNFRVVRTTIREYFILVAAIAAPSTSWLKKSAPSLCALCVLCG
jgi:hypothetical protein